MLSWATIVGSVVLTLFALVLAGCVQLVRRALERRDVPVPGA